VRLLLDGHQKDTAWLFRQSAYKFLLTHSMEQSSQLVKKFPDFTEPGVSLPHSQVPATCPILSQLDPVHTPTSHFLKIRPPIYAWDSQVVSFPQISPPIPCIRLSSPLHMLHAPPISFFSI